MTECGDELQKLLEVRLKIHLKFTGGQAGRSTHANLCKQIRLDQRLVCRGDRRGAEFSHD